MTVTITPDLARAITESKGEPVRLTDPATSEEYVLIRAELYNRISQLILDDECLDTRQVAMLIHEAMREDDENDPLLESYQNYERKT